MHPESRCRYASCATLDDTHPESCRHYVDTKTLDVPKVWRRETGAFDTMPTRQSLGRMRASLDAITSMADSYAPSL